MARREIYPNLPGFEPLYIVSLDFDNFVPFTGARSCTASLFQEAHIFHRARENSGRVVLARVKSPGLSG